jgi:protein TonB
VSVPEPPKPVVIEEPQTIAPEPEPMPDPTPAPAAVATGNPTAGVQPAGSGDKPGSGIGDRSGPGSGDEPYGIGNGVTAPIPLRRPPPAYTAEAMRARLQGVVVLNCVVRPDGRCSDIRVLKSLDTTLGLDQQAIASAREWVFRPGMRMGQPVPVLVTLEIGFTIR